MELSFLSIKELRALLDHKKISPEELIAASIQRCERYDGELGAVLEIFDRNELIEQLSSKSAGALFAIPGLIKDTICQKGRITAAASKILENYRAPYDATAVKRLREAGAISIGRANCDEFAMGSSTETSAFKRTANPWNLDCVPGGSSGGSAAAVAAGLVPWALGSETGGSVRQPSAFCGVVGLKPTYGAISRFGLIAYASSLDQIGIVTRTVYDNALVFSTIAGHDPHDSTSHVQPKRDYTQALATPSVAGLRIGVIDNACNAEGIAPDVRSALDEVLRTYERLGAKIVHCSLPTMDYGAAVYFMVSRAEAASNLARFDGVRYGYRSPRSENLLDLYCASRTEGFGDEVRRRILIGNYVLSAGHADQYYKSAKRVQGLMRAEFCRAFEEVDLLFAPVAPTGAFKFGAFDDNRLQMDLQDYFTAPVNLVGMPAISIPCGFTHDQLPIGFQLIAPHFSEELLFKTGHAFEQETPWHTMFPERYRG